MSAVSVIVPVYNGRKHLPQAIQSILAQTLPPDEILVVDDGSTDGSGEVARGFDRVRCLRQENAGQAAAMNRGVAEARGDFLAFLDADDLWAKDKQQAQLAAFQADPALDMAFGLALQFAEPGIPPPPKSREVLRAPLHTAMLIRARSFARVGRFDVRLRYGASIEWYARAIDLGLKSAMLEQIVLRRRLHEANLGRNAGSAMGDYLSLIASTLRRRRQ